MPVKIPQTKNGATAPVKPTTESDTLLICDAKTFRAYTSRVSSTSTICMNKVTAVEINLSFTPSARLLNGLLARLSEVDTIRICVPTMSETSSLEVLRDLKFPRLVSFATTLCHQSIVTFLQQHPAIMSLSLGLCGSEKCPIFSGVSTHLTDITGPTSCISLLVRSSPIRTLTAQHYRILDVLPPLYISMRSSEDHITQLQLDFPPTERDILRSIRLAAPQVVSLKLNEILHTSFNLVQRPWELSYWSLELHLLIYLKTFLLSTAASLVDIPGDLGQEMAKISGWAEEAMIPHPRLDTIAVWYSRGDYNEHLSWFFRRAQGWARVRSYDSPAEGDF